MRVPLSGLFRRILPKDRRAADAMRARRQAFRAREVAGGPDRSGQDADDCRCYGCSLRRTALLHHAR